MEQLRSAENPSNNWTREEQNMIDMDPKREHLVRIEGCFPEICDMLGEAVEAKQIDSYEVIDAPHFDIPDNGCGCMGDPPCKGCSDEADLSEVPVDSDANRLNLYAVWTINGDTSETEKVYIMALHEEGAACLYHQSRARDHGNILCEVVVSKVADAEVCDG